MTRREEELLALIKKNPMATQQQLADTLGITRSSVAVHLSSLMKKGKIRGRAYIVEEDEKISVIGGMNVDLQGFPLKEMKLYDSNPGRILRSAGGVGRNLAEILAKLKVPVRLLSAVGKDDSGKFLLEETAKWGVDVRDVLQLQEETSVYLSLMDEQADMLVAFNQMDILENVDHAYLAAKQELLRRSPALVIDANLREDVLLTLCKDYGEKKIFAETVSAAKVHKLKECLPYLYSMKANLLELQALVGKPLNAMRDYKEALGALLDCGVRVIFLSLGAEGVLCATQEKILQVKGRPKQVRSATGAGDAFFAGAIAAILRGQSLEESVCFAQGAALLTLEEENTSVMLSRQAIEERRKDVELRTLPW